MEGKFERSTIEDNASPKEEAGGTGKEDGGERKLLTVYSRDMEAAGQKYEDEEKGITNRNPRFNRKILNEWRKKTGRKTKEHPEEKDGL